MIRITSVGWPALREEREACVVHREPGAVVVRVEWHGRAVLIGSIYAPSKPGPRVDFSKLTHVDHPGHGLGRRLELRT
jgi:hypothetical protein